jgi:hypothetical protein
MGNMKSSIRRIRLARRNPNYRVMEDDPRKDVPEGIFERIVARYPDYRVSETLLVLERPKGHPELDEFLAFASTAGAKIQRDRSDTPAQIWIMDYRKFGEEEIDLAGFVECLLYKPTIAGVESVPEENGLGLRCLRPKGSRRQEFGSVPNLYHILAVRGDAKRRLESEQLKHLTLLPVLTNKEEGWADESEPMYWIWSDFQLPPVDLPVFDDNGNVFKSGEGPSQRCYLLDGYEMNPQLKYAKLEEGGFDIAYSCERFGGAEPCYHKLVYSQKARKVLEDIGMKIEAVPVRVGS